MIFYFSGTGNSEYVAQAISSSLGDKCVFIPDVITYNGTYEMSDGERLGFVFPVYSWGVPSFIVDFITRLSVNNVSYVYFVCTCGDDTGMIKEQMATLIEHKGWHLSLGYSVQMPNTYVCFPGFDIDKKDVEEKKLSNAKLKIEEVVRHLVNNDDECFDTIPGDFAWLKSKIILPLFNKYMITAKPFRTTDSCIHCGKCVSECPMKNIKLDEDTSKPKWGDNCVGCLHCYHFCPTNSIQFGRLTNGKGQYCYKKK